MGTSKMKLQKDLREFIELLNAHDVKYVIVGGYAVAFHGYPRFTGDVDIFIEASDANSRRMEKAVRRFGFSDTDLSAADFANPDTVVQLGLPPNRIDVVTTIDAVEFDEAWHNKMDARLDGIPVSFISKDLLIRNKTASARAQDLADIQEIDDAEKP